MTLALATAVVAPLIGQVLVEAPPAAAAGGASVWAYGISSSGAGDGVARDFTPGGSGAAPEQLDGVAATSAAVTPDGTVWELGEVSGHQVLARYGTLGAAAAATPGLSFTVPSGIEAIAADGAGDLWALEGSEVVELHPGDLSSGRIPSTPTLVLQASYTNLAVSAAGDLALWSWSGHSVSLLSAAAIRAGGTPTPVQVAVPSGQYPTAATWDAAGTLWLAGTPNWSAPADLYGYHDAKDATPSSDPTTTTPLRPTAVNALAVDQGGNIWCGGTDGHVYEYGRADGPTIEFDSGWVGGGLTHAALQQFLVPPAPLPGDGGGSGGGTGGSGGSGSGGSGSGGSGSGGSGSGGSGSGGSATDHANSSMPAGPQYSIYSGWGDTSEPSAFAALTHQPTTWAMDFLQGDSWSSISSSASNFPSRWRAASTVSNMVWGVPIVPGSFRPSQSATAFAEIVAGDEDGVFTDVARGIAASYPHAIVRLAWEFNGNWFPWASADSESALFVAAWRHVVSVMRAAAPDLTYLWNPTRGATDVTDPAAFYPGDAYVDEVGLDVYDMEWGSYPGIGAEWDHMLTEPYGLDWLASFAAGHTKRIALPEWGLGFNGATAPVGGGPVASSNGAVTGGDDGGFVSRSLAWISSHDALGSFWDYGSRTTVSSTQNPSTVDAFRAFFSGGSVTTARAPQSAGNRPSAVVTVSGRGFRHGVGARRLRLTDARWTWSAPRDFRIVSWTDTTIRFTLPSTRVGRPLRSGRATLRIVVGRTTIAVRHLRIR